MAGELPQLVATTQIVCEYGKLVFRDSFREPSGKTSEWLLFGATKTPVVVFPITSGGSVIALRHFRYGANTMVLELPGGSIEAGNDAEGTVISELSEETLHACERTD